MRHRLIVRRVSLAALPVIVMSKLPVAGRVKTRLTPALTPQQAAEVHRLFLLHLLDRLIDLAPAELVVCFDPPDAGASMAALLSPRSLQLIAQSEGDLGNRLAIAANSIFERFDRVLFLGVDSPDVPVALLQNAAELTAGSDVVLGPTLDGGFWCLGLRRGIDVASVLSDIPWSSGGEREATIRRAASAVSRAARPTAAPRLATFWAPP